MLNVKIYKADIIYTITTHNPQIPKMSLYPETKARYET